MAHGVTNVPSKITIQINNEIYMREIIWDMREDQIDQTIYFNPQFPPFLYPIKKISKYGATSPLIPVFSNNIKDAAMLWVLIGMLSRIEELWFLVYNFRLRQSNLHGCLLHIYPLN